MATCSPSELLAAAKCFSCLSEKELRAVMAQLLCNISGGGGGGSQTPWTSNIDGGGFDLTNVDNLVAATLSGNGAGLTNLDLDSGLKVYRAFVTQATSRADNGTLIVGREYLIFTLEAGDDFSNVGYVSDGVTFIATGTTPTVWANGTFAYDVVLSTPTAVVLKNTLGVSANWSYESLGRYRLTAVGAFPTNKTQLVIQAINPYTTFNRLDDDTLETFGADATDWDRGEVFVEVTVYP